MKLLGVKYFGVDLGFKEIQEDGAETKPLYIEIIADVENNGNITELRRKYRLTSMDFADFMTNEDLEQTINNITTDITPAQFVQIFANTMLKAIAAETGYNIVGEDYVAPPTLREETTKIKEDITGLQSAVAELSVLIATSILTE